MSLGKLPGFKGLGSGSQGKRRFQSDLSVDMIGPPMADFRHTMHVGRGGEVFGDTSFLSDHGGGREEPAGSPDAATGFFTRTFRHVRREPRPRGGSRELSSPPPPSVSPIIKNAVSLPQLNVDAHANGCLQRVLFPSSASNDAFYSYGLQAGYVTLPRLSRLDRGFPEGNTWKGSSVDGAMPTRSDSWTDFTDFTFDLGPSLMSEVLSLIDSPGGLLGGNVEAEGREEEEEEEEEEEDDRSSSVLQMAPESPASSLTSTRGSSRASDWTERAVAGSGGDSARTPPDASCRSPQGAEPGMGAERFQRASGVLSRHYGGGSFSHRDAASPPPSCLRTTASFSGRRTTPRSCAEEEEEIKV
ncbi:unnamed protein product [Merluccius merluccius]